MEAMSLAADAEGEPAAKHGQGMWRAWAAERPRRASRKST